MIILDRVTKNVAHHGEVLSDVSVQIPADRRIAVFGQDEKDKYIFLRLIAGIMSPTSGHILRKAKPSFPVGYHGGFWPELSVRENVSYVARLYGVAVAQAIWFVQYVTRIGPEIDRPYGLVSKRMRSMVNIAMSYSIPFDVYLIGNAIARGDPHFKQVSSALFAARTKTSGAILTTRDERAARQYCDMGAILHRGQFVLYEDLEQAISVYNRLPPILHSHPSERFFEEEEELEVDP